MEPLGLAAVWPTDHGFCMFLARICLEMNQRPSSKRSLYRGLGLLALVLVAPFGVRYFQWALTVSFPEPVLEHDQEELLGVTDMVRQVKAELEAAEQERIERNEAALFLLESFDLEINFVLRNSSSRSVGFSPQFLVVNENTNVSTEKVQKLRLHMRASPPRGSTSEAISGVPSDIGNVVELGTNVNAREETEDD